MPHRSRSAAGDTGKRCPGLLLLLAVTMLLIVLNCDDPDAAKAPDTALPRVFVSIPPQKFFVERIAGDLVSVDVLLPPGQSPATYEPTPKQMSRLSQSAVLLRIGVPFENRLMKKITGTMPELTVVDTRRGIKLRKMEGSATPGHDHHHGDHTHERGAPDPHCWLDPRLAMVQARTIHDALLDVLPGSAEALGTGLHRLTEDLQEADRRLARALEPLRGRSIFVFHPAYGYLADAYGLRQVAVEVEGKEPSAKQLALLIEKARRDQVCVIFHQPQFAHGSVETVAREIGGTAVELDPLAEDYLANLDRMAADITAALKAGTH